MFAAAILHLAPETPVPVSQTLVWHWEVIIKVIEYADQ